jgi:hypothetical protein
MEDTSMEIQAPERVEPRKTGNQTVDLVLSVCALLISGLSIFLAWYTGDSMDQLVQANSWPALQLGSGNASDEGKLRISLTVENAGIGPAQIHRLDVLVDGVDITDRNGALIHLLVEACCGEDYKKALARAGGDPVAALGADMTRPVARTFLSPRQEANVLLWPKTEANSEIWSSVDQARRKGRISLRACYCSVFDECWIAQTYTFPPRKVDDCKPATISAAK